MDIQFCFCLFLLDSWFSRNRKFGRIPFPFRCSCEISNFKYFWFLDEKQILNYWTQFNKRKLFYRSYMTGGDFEKSRDVKSWIIATLYKYDEMRQNKKRLNLMLYCFVLHRKIILTSPVILEKRKRKTSTALRKL